MHRITGPWNILLSTGLNGLQRVCFPSVCPSLVRFSLSLCSVPHKNKNNARVGKPSDRCRLFLLSCSETIETHLKQLMGETEREMLPHRGRCERPRGKLFVLFTVKEKERLRGPGHTRLSLYCFFQIESSRTSLLSPLLSAYANNRQCNIAVLSLLSNISSSLVEAILLPCTSGCLSIGYYSMQQKGNLVLFLFLEREEELK